MASSVTLKSKTESGSPYTLDPDQTLRAATALLAKIKADAETKKSASTEKQNLLEDADESDDENAESTPVWLTLTTKKHIIDKQRLKPAKILLPHSLYASTPSTPALRICLITADPQRTYKDLVAHDAFPSEVASTITRVIGIKKLSAKYHSYESKRQLASEYDLFLADDRVITALPRVLGKTFYAQGSKRPVPVCLQGKKQGTEKQPRLSEGGVKKTRAEITPVAMANEIDRATKSAAVHLAPSTSTAIRVGSSDMTARQVADNITTVVNEGIERFVPQKWRNVRAIHIKGPETAALPIWLASELWVDQEDILEDKPVVEGTELAAVKTKKRKAEGKGDRKEKKRAAIEAPGAVEDVRKALLKKQKLEARTAAAAATAANA